MLKYQEAVTRLIEVPGIGAEAAQEILAEIGPEAAAFPSAGQLASWIGVCPGSDESAGENHSGRCAKGNRFPRRLLCQSAQAAVRTKGSHLESVFKRFVVRLGYVKAVWAIAHRISEARNPKAIRRAINLHLSRNSLRVRWKSQCFQATYPVAGTSRKPRASACA